MSSPGEPDGLLIRSRAALLDALHALGAHRDSVVVIGAQAINLRTFGAAVAVAEATKDSDLAIDPRTLGEEPLIDGAMETAGFVLDPVKRQPGAWLSADGVPVDLMVPQDLAGAGSATTRGARIPPHHKRATRRARWLEAAMVDNSWLGVAALDPADDRRFEVRVASSPLVPRRPAQRWPVVPKLASANQRRWRSRARHSQRTSSTPWSATAATGQRQAPPSNDGSNEPVVSGRHEADQPTQPKPEAPGIAGVSASDGTGQHAGRHLITRRSRVQILPHHQRTSSSGSRRVPTLPRPTACALRRARTAYSQPPICERRTGPTVRRPRNGALVDVINEGIPAGVCDPKGMASTARRSGTPKARAMAAGSNRMPTSAVRR